MHRKRRICFWAIILIVCSVVFGCSMQLFSWNILLLTTYTTKILLWTISTIASQRGNYMKLKFLAVYSFFFVPPRVSSYISVKGYSLSQVCKSVGTRIGSTPGKKDLFNLLANFYIPRYIRDSDDWLNDRLIMKERSRKRDKKEWKRRETKRKI